MDGHLIPTLLGRLGGDDLKILNYRRVSTCNYKPEISVSVVNSSSQVITNDINKNAASTGYRGRLSYTHLDFMTGGLR